MQSQLIGGNYSEAIRKVSGVVDCPIEYIEDLGGAKGQCNFSTIKVLKGMSEAQTLKTLLHETAHFLLHKDCSTTKELAEVEAESVAYVVSNWLGLDASDYSFGYVLGWGSKLSIEDSKETFKRISKCSKCIIDKIEDTN